MNTIITPAASAAKSNVSVAPAIGSDSIESTVQEISNLRAQLALAEQTLANEKLLADQQAREKRREAIASIPGLLGVTTLAEAMALLKAETPTHLHNRALPQSTLETARQMLENGATSPAVAKALKMGLSTVWAYKAKWGLTKSSGPTTAKRRTRTRPGRHLSTETKLAIWDAMQKPGAKVAEVARRYGTSRQSTYAVMAQGRAKG